MLDAAERRNAARTMILHIMTLTDSISVTQAALKVGMASPSTFYQWTQGRGGGKTGPVGTEARTIDRILDHLPPEKMTPHFRSMMHRLAARTCGYEV